MTAKEYLKQIEQKRRLIRRDKARLQELSEIATSVKGISYDYDRVQSSNHGGMEGIERIVDMEMKLKREILQYLEISTRIIEQINLLEDMTCSELLYLRYVECLRWEEISCRMGIGIRGVYKAHGRALNIFYEKYKEFI